jgi:hypothetical protein
MGQSQKGQGESKGLSKVHVGDLMLQMKLSTRNLSRLNRKELEVKIDVRVSEL